MTHLEALERVEKALTDLELKDKWGEQLVGLEALGIVHKVFGDSWDANEDDFASGRLSPDEYAERAMSVIEEFRKYRLRERLEKVLSSLSRSGEVA